jgi:uncharacterized protein (UPF0276 family)
VKHLGHGIGLRRQHHQAVLEAAPGTGPDWLEVITENFLVPGGNPRRVLREARERYPVALHGVSLSIGSSDPLDEDYLGALRRLADEVQPAWISDHLCWTSIDGRHAHDLLPLPYNEEALRHVVARVAAVQERLGRRLVLENVSTYVELTSSTMSEAEFFAEVARRSDCQLLVDLNNIFVSAHNHGWDACAYLRALPAERVAQYHLAGPSEAGALYIDTHDHPVRDEVWALYDDALAVIGPRPTVVEWDAAIPPLSRLLEESARARSTEAAHAARRVA